jgi:RNA polymerase sigma factor (sigma-70 family)
VDDQTRQLTAAMARGDPEAIAAFYRERFTWMFARARCACGRDESFCLDVVQDAMLRIVRCIQPVNSTRQLEAWLTLVVKSVAYDLLRREARRARYERQAARGEVAAPPNGDDEAYAWLVRRMEGLDPQMVRIINLRYYEGWTLQRIAGRLGLSIGTIDGRLRRALLEIRRGQENGHGR